MTYGLRRNGFTLIEAIITMAVVAIALTIGIPALQGEIHRSRFLGSLSLMQNQLLSARQEALRYGFEIVAQFNTGNGQMLIFANVDADPAYVYTPDPTATYRTADYTIGSITLPRGVEFGGKAGAAIPDHQLPLSGFTVPAGGGTPVAVFRPDASIRDTGAVRMRDTRGNVFQLAIAPQATAKISVMKYHDDPPWGGNPNFFARGRHTTSKAPLWKWK